MGTMGSLSCGASYYIYGGANSTNTTAGTTYIESSIADTSSCYIYLYADHADDYQWSNLAIYYRLETKKQRRNRLARETRARCKREKANERAKIMFEEMFGEEYKVLNESGVLNIDSQKHQGMRYRISRDSSRMIEIVDAEGTVVDRLCIETTINCPDWDVILAKIMLAKFDEDKLHEVANHFGW